MSLMKSYRDAAKAAAYGKAPGHEEAINEETLRNQEREVMLRYRARMLKRYGPARDKRRPFVYVEEPALNDDYIRLVVLGENDTNIWSVKWADQPVTFFRNPLRRLAPRVRR